MSAAPLTPDSFVARSPDLLMVEVDGETVLMSIARGSYIGLATTARDIWLRIETKTRVCDLCAALAAAYEGDPAVIEAETLAFLAKMTDSGLVAVE
jgi:Coenzyme PQQ synthesis protein D (PqqD)